MDQLTLLQLSRPRAWAWVLIPFGLGLLASGVHPAALFHPTVAVYVLYFTLPANLLLYGLEYVDEQHSRDQSQRQSLRQLSWQIFAVTVPFLAFMPFLDLLAALAFVAFVAAAILYVRPPLRAKHHPVLRPIFVLRYALPAVFGFFLMGGRLASLF